MATTLSEYKAALAAQGHDWDALPEKDRHRLASFLPCSDIIPGTCALRVNWPEFWSRPRRGTEPRPQDVE